MEVKNEGRKHNLRSQCWKLKRQKNSVSVDSMKLTLAEVPTETTRKGAGKDKNKEMPILHEAAKCDEIYIENTPDRTKTGKVKSFLYSLFGRCWYIY